MISHFLIYFMFVVNSLAHQLLEKFGGVPGETSFKKCVTVDVIHIVFLAIKAFFQVRKPWPDGLSEPLVS